MISWAMVGLSVGGPPIIPYPGDRCHRMSTADGGVPGSGPSLGADEAVHRPALVRLELPAAFLGLRPVLAVHTDVPVALVAHLFLPGPHRFGVDAAVIPGVAVRVRGRLAEIVRAGVRERRPLAAVRWRRRRAAALAFGLGDDLVHWEP